MASVLFDAEPVEPVSPLEPEPVVVEAGDVTVAAPLFPPVTAEVAELEPLFPLAACAVDVPEASPLSPPEAETATSPEPELAPSE